VRNSGPNNYSGISSYTEVQALLIQCKAGVNWQNVQVKPFPAIQLQFGVAFGPGWADHLPVEVMTRRSNCGIWMLSKPIRTLSGHSKSVLSVAFDLDGQSLASSSKDKNNQAVGSGHWKLLHTLSGHLKPVGSVAFSPIDRVSGGWDNTIKLWNLDTGKLVRNLSGHSEVFSVTFSPDGQTLASSSKDNTIKLWNPGIGKLLYIWTFKTSQVVAFSSDGQTLASGGGDKTIKIWNLRTGG